jgi:hypothetical protein
MKKRLPPALLALVACGLWATPSFAGAFGLFTCGCCCGRNCCTFCVRPYNAFSPTCCGTVFCDGCMPLGSGGAPGALNYGGIPCGPTGCDGGVAMGPVGSPDGGVVDGALAGTVTETPGATGAPVITGAPAAPAAPAAQAPASLQPTAYHPGAYPHYNYGYQYPAAYGYPAYGYPGYAAPAPAAYGYGPMQPQGWAAPAYWGR